MAAVPAMAEAVDPAEAISIEKPSGWKQGSTDVHITVDGSRLGEGISVSKVEAKVGEGSWQDVTAGMAVTININTTVYVRITDSEGNIYEQNRSIRCYDTEKPTLSASLTDGVLTIQGQDTFSGISRITVNGAEYKELKDGVLKIQLTQKDFTTKAINDLPEFLLDQIGIAINERLFVPAGNAIGELKEVLDEKLGGEDG